MTLSKLTQQEIENRVEAGIRRAFDALQIPSPTVMVVLEERMKQVEKVAGENYTDIHGNGKDGIKTKIIQIEERLKVIYSDMKEVKEAVQNMAGYAGVKFDKDSHPNRRFTDEKKEEKELGSADKLLLWITSNVLPGLVQNFIQALITGIIALIGVVMYLKFAGVVP